jgi:ATP-dependent DNA helicase DinG
LSDLIEDYTYRPQQHQMAGQIALAISSRQDLIVEAGTGNGKTLSYLLPAMLSGQRVLISSSTKTLQFQLLDDIRRLSRVLNQTVSVAVLKGRDNYLCPARLEQSIGAVTAGTAKQTMSRLQLVKQWWSRSGTGELSEILEPDSNDPLTPLITSTSESCTGQACAFIARCPVYKARQRAAEANIVIVNHHLLFAWLTGHDALQLLPPRSAGMSTVIVDEAHDLAEIAQQFYGVELRSESLRFLVRSITAEVKHLGNDDSTLRILSQQLEALVVQLADSFRQAGPTADNSPEPPINNSPERPVENSPEPPTNNGFSGPSRCGLEQLSQLLQHLNEYLIQVEQRSFALQEIRHGTSALLFAAQALLDSRDGISWRENRQVGFALHYSPESVADKIEALIRQSSANWIFSSATLSVDNKFDYFQRKTGLGFIPCMQFESAFHYETQVKCWVPAEVSRPGTDEHTRQLIEACLPLLASGPTLMLFTRPRALQLAHQLLATKVNTLLVQGTSTKQYLLERFNQLDSPVLLATMSFWEGVDLGQTGLKLLVMDKLPFKNLSDPEVKGRLAMCRARNEDSFDSYMLPEAVIALRQGFGRLIRHERQRGLFVLGDPRIDSQSYGSVFKHSLPNMEWLAEQQQALDYLQSVE